MAALPRAFPHVPLFTIAAGQIRCLVEMAADDAATRRSARLTLAGALMNLAVARVPAEALGAGGTATAQRIQRLIESPRPASRTRRVLTGAAVLVAVPGLMLSAPAIGVWAMSGCPVSQAHPFLAGPHAVAVASPARSTGS